MYIESHPYFKDYLFDFSWLILFYSFLTIIGSEILYLGNFTNQHIILMEGRGNTYKSVLY